MRTAIKLAIPSTTNPEPATLHAPERWARVAVAVALCPRDPRTLKDWAYEVGVSSSTLREWCRLAHLKPKSALDFARLLRAVTLAHRIGRLPEDLLDISERRTLLRLFQRASLGAGRPAPTTTEFLVSQTLIQNHECLAYVERLLATTAAGSPR